MNRQGRPVVQEASAGGLMTPGSLPAGSRKTRIYGLVGGKIYRKPFGDPGFYMVLLYVLLVIEVNYPIIHVCVTGSPLVFGASSHARSALSMIASTSECNASTFTVRSLQKHPTPLAIGNLYSCLCNLSLTICIIVWV